MTCEERERPDPGNPGEHVIEGLLYLVLWLPPPKTKQTSQNQTKGHTSPTWRATGTGADTNTI